MQAPVPYPLYADPYVCSHCTLALIHDPTLCQPLCMFPLHSGPHSKPHYTVTLMHDPTVCQPLYITPLYANPYAWSYQKLNLTVCPIPSYANPYASRYTSRGEPWIKTSLGRSVAFNIIKDHIQFICKPLYYTHCTLTLMYIPIVLWP